MAVFSYKGRNARGEAVQGTLDGADSGNIADQLAGIGIIPTEIKPSSQLSAASPKLSLPDFFSRKKRVDPQELMLFSRQMHTLLKAGVPIMRALAGLQESSQNEAFSVVLQDLRDSLNNGRELSIAMRHHPKVFTAFYISMVQVGEMTGRLDETFMRLYSHLEFEKQMNESIRAALRYPMFVIIAVAGAVVVVNLFVIPSFAKVFAGLHTELPLMTRLLMGFSNFMVHYWALILALGAGASYGFRAYINTPDGRFKWDRYKFRLPIAGKIIFKSTLARFARSLALSFKSGIPIVQGLGVVALVVDNEYMRSCVDKMREGVERGDSILRTSAASGVFNPTVLQMIAVGEETGDLDGLMLEVAGMYEREVEYDVKTLSQQIEPILVVFLGVMVLILALGIFLPMWDMGSAAMHH
ncbi:MAG: type II secretion system F family protein [Nitrosomonadales bacterium]|nr:type II secretion system F family protein [Nitrosomonadales bacterium]